MKEIFDLIDQECARQKQHIELIASENFVSKNILRALGSILTNKYAEGYPNARYYGGCEIIDQIEQKAIDLAKELFGADHANVQPHAGSQANMAVYMACLEPGDTVLGMGLNSGGHLTHGSPVNFSGQLYNFIGYDVEKDTEMLDMDKVRTLAHEVKPKLIVAGASAYSQSLDFKKFREIADEVGALLMVDMAHIAGLVAAGLHNNPVPHAHFVTSTTHKTLRGPRSGLILCKEEWAKKIDKSVFPGMQGGPLEHAIGAKAICFYEALQPEFKAYQQQVLDNTQALVNEFKNLGVKIISGGSVNHLLMIDVLSSYNITGKEAETILNDAGFTVNKNMIPFDTQKPRYGSGIRLGTAAMTTRGFEEEQFVQIARWIDEICRNPKDKEAHQKIYEQVLELCRHYDLVKGEPNIC